MGNVFFLIRGISRWTPDIQLGIKTMYMALLADLTADSQQEESWEGHPSSWAVRPETSLLDHTIRPSNDPPRAGVLLRSHFVYVELTYCQITSLFSKITSASRRIRSGDIRNSLHLEL